MNIKQLIEAFTLSIESGEPCLAVSAPGIGKSDAAWQSACQVAEKQNLIPVRALDYKSCIDEHGVRAINPAADYQFFDLRVSQLESVDLRGIPSVMNGKTHWSTPDFWPSSGNGVLFLDELSSANKSMQTPLYQLLHDRRVGDYCLPHGFSIISAGNRQSDRATAQAMSSALMDRLFVVEVQADFSIWADWFKRQHGLSFFVLAFLSFRKDLLHTLDATQNSSPIFASPRSWARLARMWNRLESSSDVVRAEVAHGIVGAASVEFLGFIRSFGVIPTFDEVITNPEAAKIPIEPSAKSAVCAMIARQVSNKTFKPVWQYLKRLPLEFSVAAIQLAVELSSPIDPKTGQKGLPDLIGAPGWSDMLEKLQGLWTM